ncbi:MAG: aminodeoxychorismate synthase component I [Woeseiaceae bacterium]
MQANVDFRELHFNRPDCFPFLLQSTSPGTALGRFDILFALPGSALVADTPLHAGDFLRHLDSAWESERIDSVDSELPFHGGWFVYLGYELAEEIEPALNLRADRVLPRAIAVRCPAALIFDHRNGQTTIVCEASRPDCMESVLALLSTAIAGRKATAPNHPLANDIGEDDPQHFVDAVIRAKRYIADGDVFQANLSREWSLTSSVAARDIYNRLASSNPAPFAGSACWQDAWIISSSPERLLSLRDGIAMTRPIAGTRPRAANIGEDRQLSEELIAHPKERAEHVMLIDLERNDLGRICEAGTVEVDEMMVLESYAHVHHIVSNVRGRLRPDVTPGEAIRAVFPGGTITGCPKVRCMQIIAELENAARGAYTGSFGYLNRDGSMDLNILIRTLVKQGETLRFRAGAGIVADSDPQAELAETRAKARGLLEALR